MNKTAIAVLTRVPDQKQLLFYSEFQNHGFEVFFFIDDNEYKVEKCLKARYIQIDEKECIRYGFYNFAPPPKCGAWDKALYYFCRLHNDYANVWFVEDDVFIPNCQTLLDIDRRYGDSDIISAPNIVNRAGLLDDWHWWKHIPDRMLPPPWCKAMVCGVRLSNELLKSVNEFIEAHSTRLRITNEISKLYNTSVRRRVASLLGFKIKKKHLKYLFIEYIFHTIALHNNKRIVGAEELESIVWRKVWRVQDMNEECLYHPIKDIAAHEFYRVQIRERARSWARPNLPGRPPPND